MCGIAGFVNLEGDRPIEVDMIERMAEAIEHRGPDEDGFLVEPNLALANRRLSIVGLADGRQPIFNEDESIGVVFNGEFFDYPEKRAWLEDRGHVFRTNCDTELLVHLWEEFGEGLFDHLRGQYAFALYDRRQKILILGRDRIGICPLHWAKRGNRLYFGSEIKSILASGEVTPEADPRGLDHIMTFFAMGTRRTAFKEISAVLPGSYLKISLAGDGPAEIREHIHWELDFPDRGEEYDPRDDNRLVDEFSEIFFRAVDQRLRADVPVVGYLSGGVDSTTVMATAAKIRGAAVPAFTIRIPTPGLDETDRALLAARTIGADPTILTCGSEEIAAAYPKLVLASESPVMDTSCAALYCLAGEVRRQGYKATITGEGADEAFAGYPWFKTNRLLNFLDGQRIKPSNLVRRAYLRLTAKHIPWANAQRIQSIVGGPHAALDLYGLVSLSRSRFYSSDMFEQLNGHIAYEDIPMNLGRIKRWHPLNQSLYLGYKVMLPGLLMNHKGDRPAMHNSIEARFPFLDEEVISFCSRLHPRYKLKGLRRDKHLLRLFASRMLPPEIADRPKAMFRAPFANTFFENPPAFANQLLSEESLRRTGYFDPKSVLEYRNSYQTYGWGSGRRLTLEMGLTGVMGIQLWHHLFLGGGLCDLPTWTAPTPAASMAH
ncbi:Asparagine synthetase [glutamine-hydrolyzing] 1 [Planctomycetes bacterium Pan216]|uniref:asparagine synthase (glutamine-hydrolyzing) n=1 Tax=Kolteria novifilia TaxID=2527975 RepID=A0A518B869_9BACT|nr:Asparagine synthetase [glutamine-hydrolyzing] 1 [Planctomycetes bacterium Pan216]